jgi:hypothetical protein
VTSESNFPIQIGTFGTLLQARRLERWRDPRDVGMDARLAAVMGETPDPDAE